VSESDVFHVVTVGWAYAQVTDLWNRIAERSETRYRFSHVLHPTHTTQDRPDAPPQSNLHFFRTQLRQDMPEADRAFLASLECGGVPTIHNMILGDPIISKIDYGEALRFATFLARRLMVLYSELNPSVVIGSFDCLHSGISLAVARKMNIPWYALNFSVIPQGFACFNDAMSANSRVLMQSRPRAALQEFAEEWLRQFEGSRVQAYAYIAPSPLSLFGQLANLPRRLGVLLRTLRNAGLRRYLQYTEGRNLYSVGAALAYLRRAARARKAIAAFPANKAPPNSPYVLFGLHLQPESSIDVWAPFFSNQMWVIELLARSLPPSHKLLVKIHKSDISNWVREQLEQMCWFPGVEIVAPFADMRGFIQQADLLVTIQGTMGLEGALLGKPVIILGDSPVIGFPSVSRIGRLTDLPALVRSKLGAPAPSRREIVAAYASYLEPFASASHNDWTVWVRDNEIDGYISLLGELERHLEVELRTPREAAP
jgi:capsule polysaccharide modification protein KpsS